MPHEDRIPPRRRRRPAAAGRLLLLLLFLILLAPGAASTARPDPDPGARDLHLEMGGGILDVRVGVVASEDFADEFRIWSALLTRCVELSGGRFRFSIAPGTYGDLLHWMENGDVDLVNVTPGVFAEARRLDTADPFDYVATTDMKPATGPWVSPERREKRFHDSYRAVCFTTADAPVDSFEDLAREAAARRVKFVFVDPLSVSGGIAPRFALAQAGIEAPRSHTAYTYSHTNALRHVAASPPGGRIRVGFTWDDAVTRLPELAGRLKRIPFPALDALAIPYDVMAIRRGFPGAARLRECLLVLRTPEGLPAFQPLPDWERRYDAIAGWMDRAGGGRRYDADAQRVALDEIGAALLHAARSLPEPPRLALVLSGGGAKCAYQAGAVAAIEERLERIREQAPECGIDIDVVVGTSGGAINAVPIALGITRTAGGREDLKEMWRGLDQRAIVVPSPPLAAALGVWVALFELAFLLFLARRLTAVPARRGRILFAGAAALALLQFAAFASPLSPWRILGDNHLLHHAFLWFDHGARVSALPLLLFALAGFAVDRAARRRGARLHVTRGLLRIVLLLLVALPVAQVVLVLFFQRTLSEGSGMEAGLEARYRRIVDRHLVRLGTKPLARDPAAPAAERLRAMSREILGRGLVSRELVITGNILEQSRPTLPSDVYFYTWSPRDRHPPFGGRGVLLDDHPEQLLDVVLGSSTIFPVFPPRTLHGFPAGSDSVELVDGGFAHNSPIEAAVLRGATHVIVVESTPDIRGLRRNFAENVGAAFSHLHKQTQLVDLRSKKQVVVFTLSPEPPHICVLDFADNLIERAVEAGYREARGLVTDESGENFGLDTFRKELGRPLLTPVGE